MSFAPLDSLLEHLVGVARFLIIAGGPLPLCAALLTSGMAPTSIARKLLVTLTLWCVIQADVALFVGLVRSFTPTAVIAVELLLLLFGGAALIRHRAGWRAMLAEARHAAQRTSRYERMVAIALLLVAVSLLWHVAAVPIIDWDSWAFHMPAMARWLEAGEFVRLEQYALRPRGAYPYTWEAVCALFLMPFGEDTGVAFPALVAWVMLGLATAATARDLSAGRLHALTAAALVMSIPHLQGQVNSLHVDLPFAAFFMAALSFGLAFHRRRLRSDLVLFMAALGLLCGLRATGAVYAAALATFLLALRRWGRAPTGPRIPATVPPLLVVLCVTSLVFISPFWWLKNLLDYGAALGPIPLRAAGVSAAATYKGSLTSLASTALAFSFAPLALSSWKQLAERAWNEIGLPLPIMLAQLALWPAALLRVDRPPWHRQSAIIAALLVVGTITLFILTPTSALSGIQLRLGFSALGALAVAGAVAATGAGVPDLISAFLAVAAVIVTSGYSRVFQLAAVLLVPATVVRRWRPARIGTAALACLLCAALVPAMLAARVRRAQMRLEYYGPAFGYIDQNIGEDEPVGYLLSERSYFFYGTRLRRKVRYVPFPDQGPTRDWFEQLRAAGIRAVIVGPYNGQENRQAVARLPVPQGELVAVFGHGQPGEITVYRFAQP